MKWQMYGLKVRFILGVKIDANVTPIRFLPFLARGAKGLYSEANFAFHQNSTPSKQKLNL